MPSVLPMELFRVSQCDMIALVRNHKKRLVNHFQEKSNSVVKSICDQHTKLKQCIASKPKLETSFRSCACGDLRLHGFLEVLVSNIFKGFVLGSPLCPPLLESNEIFCWSTIARMIIVLTYPTSLLKGVIHSHQLRELQNAVTNLE